MLKPKNLAIVSSLLLGLCISHAQAEELSPSFFKEKLALDLMANHGMHQCKNGNALLQVTLANSKLTFESSLGDRKMEFKLPVGAVSLTRYDINPRFPKEYVYTALFYNTYSGFHDDGQGEGSFSMSYDDRGHLTAIRVEKEKVNYWIECNIQND